MQISITGRHFELTNPIKEHIEGLLLSLSKYNLDILQCRAIASSEETRGKKGFVIDLNISLAKINTVVIRQRDKDLYTAATLAIERAHKVLRRHHDKINYKHSTPMEELNAEQILKDEAMEALVSERVV